MTAQFPESSFKLAMECLQGLSDEELRALIEDEDAFENFVCTVPQIQQLEAEKESVMASNKSLAEHNLSLEPKLKDGKSSLWELYEKARSLQDELEAKRGELESLNSRTSLDTTHALLQASSAEAEEKSEDIAEAFLDGTTELDTFLSEFTPQRMTAHLRRLKTEKIAELVKSSQNRPPQYSSAPYPTSPAMMPMPHM